MTRKHGINRLEELQRELKAEYLEEVEDRFDTQMEDVLDGVQSPIEQLMAVALAYSITSQLWHADIGNQNTFHAADNVDPLEVIKDNPPQTHGIDIWPQAPIGRYRADFLVRYAHWRGGYVFGAIECDGHDHHDLTKEQAIRDRERDRFFQASGLLILRYTGKEIWRSPLKCATGALNLLERRADKEPALWWREEIRC